MHMCVCLETSPLEHDRANQKGKEKFPPFWIRTPTGRTKQTGACVEWGGGVGVGALTVMALDLPALRVLSAWLINTSFSFNGAGASRQPSKALFIWVIYVFP